MIVSSIRFQNFSCFRDERFALVPGFNLIVGDNGKGNTALLNGIAIGAGALTGNKGARSIYWAICTE